MDEIDLLRELVPDEAPRSSTRASARAVLITQANEERARAGQRASAGLLWRRRRLVGVAAAVVVVCSIAVGQLPIGPRPDPAAAAVLREVALIAAAQPVPPSDGYRYTKSEGAWLCATANAQGGPVPAPTIDGGSAPSVSASSAPSAPTAAAGAVALPAVLVPVTREVWVARDGSGRIRQRGGTPVFFSDADRAQWEAAGSPDLCGEQTWDQRFVSASETPPPDAKKTNWSGSLYFEDVDALPSDVAALTAYVRQRATGAGSSLELEMFTVVGDLLRETVAPPEVRSALYQIAAGIPGIELIGTVTDRVGRPGTAVAIVGHLGGGAERTRRILIFDPHTSVLLGEEEVLLDPADWLDAEPPVVIGYDTYLVSEIVETAD